MYKYKKCKKDFKYESELNRHYDRKIPCDKKRRTKM